MPRRPDAIDTRGGVTPESGKELYRRLQEARPRARFQLLVQLAAYGANMEACDFKATLASHAPSVEPIATPPKRRKVDVTGDDEGCAP